MSTDAGKSDASGKEHSADRDESGEGKQGDDKSDTGKSDKAGADKSGKDGDDKQRSKLPLIILGAVVIVGAVVGFFVWFAHRNQVSTDDAYTDGNVVTMVPKVSGYVTALFIDDNSRVRKGDLLLRIDARDYQTAKAQADAALALSQADLASAREALRIARVQYPAQFDTARAQQQAAAAAFAQAQASYARQHEVDRRATTQENIDASTNQQQNSLFFGRQRHPLMP